MDRSYENELKLLQTFKDMEKASSKQISIGWEQVLRITVGDLINKYNFNKQCKNEKNTELFKKVLMYYLGDDDFIKYTNNPELLDKE